MGIRTQVAQSHSALEQVAKYPVQYWRTSWGKGIFSAGLLRDAPVNSKGPVQGPHTQGLESGMSSRSCLHPRDEKQGTHILVDNFKERVGNFVGKLLRWESSLTKDHNRGLYCRALKAPFPAWCSTCTTNCGLRQQGVPATAAATPPLVCSTEIMDRGCVSRAFFVLNLNIFMQNNTRVTMSKKSLLGRGLLIASCVCGEGTRRQSLLHKNPATGSSLASAFARIYNDNPEAPT